MATNLRVKIGEIGTLTFIGRLSFQNGLEYRNFDFKRVNGVDLASSLVNVDPVTLEYHGNRRTPNRRSAVRLV